MQALVDLSITKTGSPATQELGQGNITWTMVVKNNGPDTDTGVKITDPMPAGNTYVSSATTQGTCTGGAILSCDIGTMAAGAQVTITLVTTPSTSGTQTNTVSVVGDRPETNTANNTATATVEITGPIKPPVFCVAVSKVTPGQLFVGRKTTLTIHLTKDKKAVAGIHVRIKGPKLNVKTKASNARGVVRAGREDEEGRRPDLHADRRPALQHQARRHHQRLHPAGDGVTKTPEGCGRAPHSLRASEEGGSGENLAQRSSIGLSTSPFWYARRAASVRFETPSLR